MAKASIVDDILKEYKPSGLSWHLRLDEAQRQQLDEICEAVKPGGRLNHLNRLDIAKAVKAKFWLETSIETIAKHLREVSRG